MSSYYNRVIGTLSAAESARSEDINLIQSNIQAAFQEMMNDMFGTGCILGGEEEDLKLTPTPNHIDQSNTSFDEEACEFSFYDVYLSQSFNIEKSEINTIRLQIKNNTTLEPTVFAEIRDYNFNLVKETNVQLPSTIESEDFVDVDFIFNLDHLALGEYYFVLRPVDINSIDMALNGDESIYDTIDPNQSFLVKYDANGSYNQGLQASYNGVDYLEARLLKASVVDEMTEIDSTNYDLCFEQIFSAGNTYLINPAPCIVLGQKVYPIDTHVTIDGPSLQGDRVDLVSLSPDGTVNVIKGQTFLGKKTKENYPNVDTGLKIAYITTYGNGDSQWSCTNCGHINNSNLEVCPICNEATNTKIPLIEQDDDGTFTRQRDFLERLRRLEKKMSYQIENNSPSRIKYTCEVDPTLINAGTVNEEGDLVYAEDTYGMTVKTDANGNTYVQSSSSSSTEYKWSIADQTYEVDKSVKKEINATMTSWDAYLPLKKPKKTDDDMFYHLVISTKNQKEETASKSTVKTTTSITKDGVVKDTKSTKVLYPVANLKLKITIKDKNKKVIKKLSDVATNKKGAIKLNIWSTITKLKTGTYTITASYGDKNLTNKIHVYSSNNYKRKNEKKTQNIALKETIVETTESKIKDKNVFTGKSYFQTDKITLDDDEGEATLARVSTNNEFKKEYTIPKDKREKMTKSHHTYSIKPNSQSLQSEYCLYNFELDKDCVVKSITPYIVSTKNIKEIGIILFKNDKIFNIDTNRKTYTKVLSTSKAKITEFPNIYSEKVAVKGVKKANDVVQMTNDHTFTFKKPKKLSAGVYSLLIYGALKNTKKEGYIKIREFTTAKASKYGAISRVKGTSNPAKIYIEGNSLVNRAALVKFEKYDEVYQTSGSLFSKTIDTKENITQCNLSCFSYIPDGCELHLYASNNGGKTYIETKSGGTVTFNGTGHELKWRIDFKGNKNVTPKILFKKKQGYAIKISLTTVSQYIGYEDYGRCFSTPVLNANTITRTLVANEHVKNSFSEWEYARIWMEDEDLGDEKVSVDESVTTDICIGYEYDDYSTTVSSQLKNLENKIFFSQVFANLRPSDFSRTSVDYSNYDDDVEPDEFNYRFKLQSEKMEHYTGGVIAATPTDNASNYSYGDINIEGINTSPFSYGLMSSDVIYHDNSNDGILNTSTQYSGAHIISAPYYQAKYVSTDNIIEANDDQDESVTSTEQTVQHIWQPGEGSMCDPNFDPSLIIVGTRFENGLEITDNYTDLHIDVFANLGDYEEDSSGGLQYNSETGEPIKKQSLDIDESKYYNSTHQCYYIPANTLEIVVALNKYGQIEDNNATYGKAYPITSDLLSGVHNIIPIELDDLYGSTIYSIGVRVSTQKDSNGDYVVKEELVTDENDNTVTKYPSLHSGDIIGLGTISFGGYNRFPYVPYIYTGKTERWGWQSVHPEFKSAAYALCQTEQTKSYYIPYLLTGQEFNETSFIYRRNGTFLTKQSVVNQNNITQEGNRIKMGNYISTDNSNATLFHFAGASDGNTTELGNIFRINTNIRVAPYDFVDVEYYILQEAADDNNGGKINKGDIVLNLYDTTDLNGAVPIERLPLPAWGKIQNSYGAPGTTKVVHTWFKLHTDADKIRCITIERANPVPDQQVKELRLVLNNILFYNAETMPALGPQMQLRIYPNKMNNLANTKIRKFGCIYRL